MHYKLQTGRLDKRQSYLDGQKTYKNADRKAMTTRLDKERRIDHLAQKFGYGSQSQYYFRSIKEADLPRQIRWETEDARYGLRKLMGKYHNIHKVTNKDKWRLKEEYGLKELKNPVLKIERIETTIVKSRLEEAFQLLKKTIPAKQIKHNKK